VIQRHFVVSDITFAVVAEFPDKSGVLGLVDFCIDGERVEPLIAVCGVKGEALMYHPESDDARADMAWLRSDDVRDQVIDFLRGAMELWKAEASS
jgi:hypothetical protein